MVMRRDRRGMAVLVDALLFLTVLTLTGAFLMVPEDHTETDGTGGTISTFHAVMLRGEVPGGDGSALSRTSLQDHLVLLSQAHEGVSIDEMGRIGQAVNGTLREMGSMGLDAWWVLSIDGTEHVFGRPYQDDDVSIHADRRELADGGVICTLFVIA
jgi:hypothetical protein